LINLENDQINKNKDLLTLELNKKVIPVLKEECKSLGLKIIGNKSKIIERIVSFKVNDLNVSELIINKTLSFISKNNFNPNQFYADNFNFIDIYDRSFMRRKSIIK
jgi:hypothetical protein